MPQTLSCKGSGVITIVENGGSLLGGAATEVYPFTFTPTHTSVDVTLSAGNTLEHVNLTNTTYAVNHILTPNGGIATRLKDEITGGGDVSTFNSEEGVLEVLMASLTDTLALENQISISDGTSNNRVRIIYGTGTNRILFTVTVNSVIVYSHSEVVNDITDLKNLKLKYKKNNFGCKIDDVEVDFQDSGEVPAAGTLNTIELANGVGNFNLSAKTKYINVYKGISSY